MTWIGLCSASLWVAAGGTSGTELALFELPPLLQSDATAGPAESPTSSGYAGPSDPAIVDFTRYDFQIVFQHVEFDEMSFEFDNNVVNGSDDDDVSDVDRRAVGLRFSGGPQSLRTYVEVLAEQTDIDGSNLTVGGNTIPFNDEADGFGAGFGFEGMTHLQRERRDIVPVMDYGMSLHYHQGFGDDELDEIWYLEGRGRLGAGVDVSGVQATAGILGDALVGGFDGDRADGDFVHSNSVAGYVRGAYHPANVPIALSVQAYFGELRGVELAFGIRF